MFKYNPFSMESVVCLHYSRLIDNLLVWHYPRNTISPTLSVPKLPVGLCVGLKPCSISPAHCGISTENKEGYRKEKEGGNGITIISKLK